MRIVSLVVLYFLLAPVVNGQKATTGNTITGSVTDSLHKTALEYATITLTAKGSKKPLNGTVTDKNGSYMLNEIPDGVYELAFEFIGYTSQTISEVALSKNSTVIKNLSLLPQKGSLEGVTVVATQKLVENKIDKMVFNAEKDITSQSGVATDVLKKVPQVSVDADGNVQLAGSGGVRFLINGKPSTAFGSNIADVLQSIPASQIKSIEVITNPGAKYDAQGLGGIINIILKTSNAKGYNGNLSLTTGTLMENGSFNVNVRNNNFGINAFLSGNARLPSSTLTSSERLTRDSNRVSSLQQEGSGRFNRHGAQTGMGFDWTYKKFNSFTGNIGYNIFGFSGRGATSQVLQDDKTINSPTILSFINTKSKFTYKGTDAALNYKRTFANEDQQLDIGVNASFGNDDGSISNQQFLLPKDSLFYGTQSINPGKTSETEVNIDYTQPLKKDIILGIGAKGSFDNITSTSDVLRYNPASKLFLPDASLANDLVYKQNVYALYTELSLPVSNWFTAKIGGRYERTIINSYYANAQQQVEVPAYNTFVPSVYLSKKLDDNQTIKLSYSKRIERPDYEALNPFVNTNDPKNLSAGNPNLRPESGYRYELGYNRDFGKTGSIMINFFYRVNENDIQPYIIYYPFYKVGDSIYSNVSVNTRQNIGREKNLGVNLFGDLHLNTKLTIRTNVFLFHRHTINQLDAGYDYNSFNYRFNMNAGYQFTNSLVGEFFGNFNSARHEAQGAYPSFTSYSFAVRKQFWKKKGSVALNANNFLNKYVNQRTELAGPDFAVNSVRQIPFRSVSLNFSWKFGKLEFKKDKPDTEPGNAPAIE
ncbi:MAG: TonB-dependent receptor [Ferruginibacter sp.]